MDLQLPLDGRARRWSETWTEFCLLFLPGTWAALWYPSLEHTLVTGWVTKSTLLGLKAWVFGCPFTARLLGAFLHLLQLRQPLPMPLLISKVAIALVEW